MDKGMNKENVVYAYNRILFSCKMKSKQTKKKPSVICYNMDEACGHYANYAN